MCYIHILLLLIIKFNWPVFFLSFKTELRFMQTLKNISNSFCDCNVVQSCPFYFEILRVLLIILHIHDYIEKRRRPMPVLYLFKSKDSPCLLLLALLITVFHPHSIPSLLLLHNFIKIENSHSLSVKYKYDWIPIQLHIYKNIKFDMGAIPC